MNIPSNTAFDAAGEILNDLPNLSAVLNEVNNTDSDSLFKARCYQAARESLARRVQDAINVATKTDDNAMWEWLAGQPVHVRIHYDGTEVILKGYWYEDIRIQLKQVMEKFPDSPNHPELPDRKKE